MTDTRAGRGSTLVLAALSLSGVSCATAAVMLSVLHNSPQAAVAYTVPWFALSAAFIIGDRVDIVFSVREHAIAVTPAQFVLVFGLFTVDPLTLISARVLGGAVVLVLRDERDPRKLSFNMAMHLFEVASLAAMVQLTPWWTGSVFEPGNWLIVFGALSLYTALAMMFILGAIRLSSGSGQSMRFGRNWTLTTMAETANAALGMVAVLVWQTAPWALLLLVPPAVVSYLAYVGYTRLNEHHQNLERLYDFTGVISQAGALPEVIAVTLQEAATILHARRVELLWLADDVASRWVLLGAQNVVGSPEPAPDWAEDPLAAKVLATGEGVVRTARRRLAGQQPVLVGHRRAEELRRGTAMVRRDDHAGPMLARRLHDETTPETATDADPLPLAAAVPPAPRMFGVRHRDGAGVSLGRRRGDGVAVPVHAGGSLVGVLIARGPSRPGKLFDRSDVTALSALANHAGMSLENLRLIHQLHDQADEREHEALHDALTGLGNRRRFNRGLTEALRASGADTNGLALLLVDLNGFKDVNDTLGHEAGDRLLQAVANQLRTHAGPRAEVNRLGGDEFAVLLAPATVRQAERLAQELLAVVEQPVQLNGVEMVIGASIGVACSPEHATDEATLLQRADLALYAAKARPDASIEVYRPMHGEHSARRLRVASDLRQALERRTLEVRYQPQIDLHTNRVVATEALLRWNHPELGQINPAEFVAVAENLGLIDKLTRFVVEEAVAQSACWRAGGLDLEMAINISARNLLEPAFPDHLAATLARHGVAAERITLEITETEIMHEADRATEMLTRLDQLGVGLSIDDFGTGYSSLAYLKRLPVAELKLDRSFVRDLATDASDAMIARTVIDLAGNLELRVVAEGIEDEAARRALVAMGCQRGQGFLMAEALPPDRLVRWACHFHADQHANRSEQLLVL